MIKLVKMNLFRMVHSKFTYVILLSMVAFISFVAIVSKLEENAEDSSDVVSVEENVNEVNNEAAPQESQDPDVGIQVQSIDMDRDPTIMDYTVGNFKGGLMLVFVTIFVTIFVHAEEGSGFIKNIARQSGHKRTLVLAKIPSVILYTIAVYVVYIIVNIVLVKLLNPTYAMGFSIDLLAFMGAEVFLAIVFASLIAFLTTIMKSTALGMTVGMLLAMGIGSLIINGIETITKNVVDLDQYTILGNISKLPVEYDAGVYIEALIVGVVWFVVWNVLSVCVVEKRDTI